MTRLEHDFQKHGFKVFHQTGIVPGCARCDHLVKNDCHKMRTKRKEDPMSESTNIRTTNTSTSSNAGFAKYALKTVLLNAGAIVGEGNAWRLRFQTPVSGLDVNATYMSQDAAIDRLVQVLHNQYGAERAA